jgi:hypothetical protein
VPFWRDTSRCHDVQRSSDGGTFAFAGVDTNCQTPQLVDRVSAGHVYQYRARSTYSDPVSGVDTKSEWYYGPSFTLKKAQEKSARLTYSGTWKRSASSGAVGGYIESSSQAGASVKITVSGPALGLVSKIGPGFGDADVYIDGTLAGTLSLYNPSGSVTRMISMTLHFLDAGPHTVKLVVLGTAGHPKVDVDAFIFYQ